MKATEVTAGLAESNGSLLSGLWCDSLHVTCGLTACTPGSAPGPTLGNEYGKTLPFTFYTFYEVNLVADLKGLLGFSDPPHASCMNANYLIPVRVYFVAFSSTGPLSKNGHHSHVFSAVR